MKKEFMIYKEGMTDHKITIISKVGEPFDRESKINKYLTLGYQVFEMDGKEITK